MTEERTFYHRPSLIGWFSFAVLTFSFVLISLLFIHLIIVLGDEFFYKVLTVIGWGLTGIFWGLLYKIVYEECEQWYHRYDDGSIHKMS